MQNVIVGTAGHVDHGKTCLIKALTGTDTDRLKEEQKRGITIELGFANLPNDAGIHIGIIDVPGHEKFVKNMLAGIGGIDLVLLVIALDEGVMPQTVEPKIKSEARTEQLKNKATDAMTAIASGVGSLFGSGKLKELEQANGKLQGKIDKRDNQIRLLNEHIRMQEERHSTEKHCQQEIHRQELNMKMKKAVISNKGCGLQD